MKRTVYFICILLSLLYILTDCKRKGAPVETSEKARNTITFNSSDSELNKVFLWAKKQALDYAFTGDPVGLWYEAALPGRAAFCMRDVSHQAMGAHFLGLAPYTKNMLYRFAENISDSKDWCSLWEINKYNKPAPVDYKSDTLFWYNLPANFDILDCCYRMYILTGDHAYFNDPVFLNFYKRTVYDYINRWDLDIDKIMNRHRLMNTHGMPETNKGFMKARGIPGYDEGDPGYIVAIDLVVTEHTAFVDYARFQQLRGNDEEAEKFLTKAKKLDNIINTVWWDNGNQRYYTHLNDKHKLTSRGSGQSILYYRGINDSSKLRATIKGMVENLPQGSSRSIEGQSHLPEILYHYEVADSAYKQLLFVSKNKRREYPEASYSAIGAMVTGLMGIEPEVYPQGDAIRNVGYVDSIITTQSRLTDKTAWAEIKHVPIRKNDISVRHEGLIKTIMTNNSGPGIIWKAKFYGSFDILYVNDYTAKATKEAQYPGGPAISWARLEVAPGESVTVRTNK